MDLQEVLNLIAIRSYVVNSVANPVFDRKMVKELDGLLVLLDRKIAALLLSPEFKEYINFANLQNALQEVVTTNNKTFADARHIMKMGKEHIIKSGVVKK